jgi:Protein kinase domain
MIDDDDDDEEEDDISACDDSVEDDLDDKCEELSKSKDRKRERQHATSKSPAATASSSSSSSGASGSFGRNVPKRLRALAERRRQEAAARHAQRKKEKAKLANSKNGKETATAMAATATATSPRPASMLSAAEKEALQKKFGAGNQRQQQQQKPKKKKSSVVKVNLAETWSPSDIFAGNKSTVSIDDFSFSKAFRGMKRRFPSGEYRVKEALGKGRYGTVKLAEHHPSGEQVAIKFVHKWLLKDPGDVVRLVRESRIMVGLRHKHVLQLYDVIETDQDILLVMEYAARGDLFTYICDQVDCRLDLNETLRLFRQMLDALDYLHSHYVVHRDLKPESMLFIKFVICVGVRKY